MASLKFVQWCNKCENKTGVLLGNWVSTVESNATSKEGITPDPALFQPFGLIPSEERISWYPFITGFCKVVSTVKVIKVQKYW